MITLNYYHFEVEWFEIISVKKKDKMISKCLRAIFTSSSIRKHVSTSHGTYYF